MGWNFAKDTRTNKKECNQCLSQKGKVKASVSYKGMDWISKAPGV